jgi:hypothetical protein
MLTGTFEGQSNCLSGLVFFADRRLFGTSKNLCAALRLGAFASEELIV